MKKKNQKKKKTVGPAKSNATFKADCAAGAAC